MSAGGPYNGNGASPNSAAIERVKDDVMAIVTANKVPMTRGQILAALERKPSDIELNVALDRLQPDQLKRANLGGRICYQLPDWTPPLARHVPPEPTPPGLESAPKVPDQTSFKTVESMLLEALSRGPLSNRDLCDQLYVKKSTLGYHLTRLKKLGVLEQIGTTVNARWAISSSAANQQDLPPASQTAPAVQATVTDNGASEGASPPVPGGVTSPSGPRDGLSPRFALWSDGSLEIRTPAVACSLDAAETKALVHYLDNTLLRDALTARDGAHA